jgi:hypothetical protein
MQWSVGPQPYAVKKQMGRPRWSQRVQEGGAPSNGGR